MSQITEFTELPVVDLAPLLTGSDEERLRVAQELGRAAREVGFLYVTGTGLDPRLFDDLLAATKQFFALPLADRMAVHIGRSTNHRGYVPPGEEVFSGGTKDLKEAFDTGLDLPADDPDYRSGNPMLGPNQWPDLPGFADAVTAYYRAVFTLGRALLQGFGLAIAGTADIFDRYVTKPPSQLRLIHYPVDPEAVDVVGIGAHTDYECFTLLRPTAPGLEVLNGAGEWIDVPPRGDAFVVNIGDMLETWTNGEFVATTHRVRKVAEERWSFPLFFSVDYDARVEPLPQYVSDGRPARPALVAGEHLFAQTAQSFRYLQERLERGDVTLPEGSLALSSFGREAALANATARG